MGAMLLLLLGIGLMGYFFLGTLKEVMTWVGSLPSRMVKNDIETRFTESITRIVSTNGDILEVATLETNETVTRYDIKTLFSEFIYLGHHRLGNPHARGLSLSHQAVRWLAAPCE